MYKRQAHGIDGVTTYDMFSKEDFSGIMQSLEEKSDLKLINSLLFAIYNEDAYEDYNLESFFKTKADGMNIGNWFVLDKDQKIFENPASGTDERTSDYRGNYLLFAPEYNTFYEGSGWYVSAKWYCSTNAQIRDDNAKIIPVMRATELRYIMAEYYARNGQFGEAYNILNQIRQNRGMWDNLPEGADFETFQRDLIRDAQREWISEGQLFYLYKRLGAKFNIKGTQRKMTKSEYMLPVPDDQNM